MIEIKNLEKRLSPDFCLQIPSLRVDDGDRVALIGPNGAGKSTLLRLVFGIEKPDRGSIEISAPKNKIVYQPQSPYLFKGTVETNVRLGSDGSGDVDALLRDCGLESLRGKRADRLSGGERQRVCLARTLACGGRLLLLDEPLSAADIETGERLCGVLLDRIKKTGGTLVMSTHLPRQAFETATKILILHDGGIAEYGSVDALRAPQSEFGRRFISQWKLE